MRFGGVMRFSIDTKRTVLQRPFRRALAALRALFAKRSRTTRPRGLVAIPGGAMFVASRLATYDLLRSTRFVGDS